MNNSFPSIVTVGILCKCKVRDECEYAPAVEQRLQRGVNGAVLDRCTEWTKIADDMTRLAADQIIMVINQ